MKKILYGFVFAFTFLLINKLDTNAQGVPTWTYDNRNTTYYAYNDGFIFMVRGSSGYYNVWSTSSAPLNYYAVDNNVSSNIFTQPYPYSSYVLNGVTYYMFTHGIRPSNYDGHLVFLCPVFESINDFVLPPSKSEIIDSFGGDAFNINGSLNGNTVDVFKCNPFRLLSTDYMYYEVSIKSLKQFSGSKAIVKLIGDRSTYSHTVTNPFLTSFDTIPVDDYVSVNSDFYMVCTPIDSDGNYGNSIVYKYKLTQDGIVSVYDEPIDTPKGLNVDVNNNYIPVTQINKNRAFVTNIDYSTVTYNSMNVEYFNTWDVYYAPNISTSNDNISIQNITDSYNTYNYVTNNYNDLTYGLGLNFDFGDNDISDDGNVIDTLDDIKVLLSFLPWLLGLFTFIPSGFVTIILGGFTILLVVVVVKIFK